MSLPDVPNTPKEPPNTQPPPMEFPRPPQEPGHNEPKATPSPGQPSTLPPGGAKTPGSSVDNP